MRRTRRVLSTSDTIKMQSEEIVIEESTPPMGVHLTIDRNMFSRILHIGAIHTLVPQSWTLEVPLL